MPAKNATRWMAPAAPVFAGTPAPTETLLNQSVMCSYMRERPAFWVRWRAGNTNWQTRCGPCGSGHAREECDSMDGTGCAGVRGHARSHRDPAKSISYVQLYERTSSLLGALARR
ncbi:hypothetical protein CMV24_15045 [Pseudomonas plecoglossicida]|uniref:Uncharacterized protein n=1 Tax=Pseudomonas plecoglossicida TaxID=70775 RepID=A0A2A3M3R9_PSEDL|nr:hypothetical protein CMV24_15045 [Pseudomonas plecoglossicida]